MKEITLKQLFDIKKGKKVEQIQLKTLESIRYIQIDDLRNDKNIKYCLPEKNYVYATKNDVIIAWDGANAGTIGYNLEGAIGSTLAVLKSKVVDINTHYVAIFLKTKAQFLRDNCTGATIPHISRQVLEDIKIPLPPKEIQEKIVEVIEKAQSLINFRIEQIDSLSNLAQSVFTEMFGNPILNNKWSIRPLGEYLEKIESGWSPKSESFPAIEGEKGVLKLSAVTKGVYQYKENKALYSDTPLKKVLEVKKGDLLITRKNTKELVGACSYVFDTPPNLMIPDTVFRLVFKESENPINPIFLWRLLNNNTFKRKVSSLAEGSSGSMPNISKKNLLGLEIIVPPLELQEQFSNIIINIENQKQLLINGLLGLENNLNSIKQRAFKGELFSV